MTHRILLILGILVGIAALTILLGLGGLFLGIVIGGAVYESMKKDLK